MTTHGRTPTPAAPCTENYLWVAELELWIGRAGAGARAAADFQLTPTQTHRDAGRETERLQPPYYVTAHGTRAAANN